jgi:hypothetical protein
LNDGQSPSFRVVRVALGTGYNRVEGNRWAPRNGRVSDLSHPKPHAFRFAAVSAAADRTRPASSRSAHARDDRRTGNPFAALRMGSSEAAVEEEEADEDDGRPSTSKGKKKSRGGKKPARAREPETVREPPVNFKGLFKDPLQILVEF